MFFLENKNKINTHDTKIHDIKLIPNFPTQIQPQTISPHY